MLPISASRLYPSVLQLIQSPAWMCLPISPSLSSLNASPSSPAHIGWPPLSIIPALPGCIHFMLQPSAHSASSDSPTPLLSSPCLQSYNPLCSHGRAHPRSVCLAPVAPDCFLPTVIQSPIPEISRMQWHPLLIQTILILIQTNDTFSNSLLASNMSNLSPVIQSFSAPKPPTNKYNDEKKLSYSNPQHM